MLSEFVPNRSELELQKVEGDYNEIMRDTKEEVAIALRSAGMNIDISGIDIARSRKPWWRRNYGEGYVRLGNQTYQVDPIKAPEVAAFYYDLMGIFGMYDVDAQTSKAEYQIYRLAHRYAWELFKWFRVVRKLTTLTYAGSMTTGNGLILDELLPADLDKTDWLFTASIGSQDYVGTASNPMKIADKSGAAMFAVIDEVILEGLESPIDQIMIAKNGVNYVARGYNLKQRDGVADLRGVFTFVPNDTLYIQLNGTAAKSTKFHPIGVVLIPVEKAKQLGVNRIKA